jgi:hypothetical protein
VADGAGWYWVAPSLLGCLCLAIASHLITIMTITITPIITIVSLDVHVYVPAAKST